MYSFIMVYPTIVAEKFRTPSLWSFLKALNPPTFIKRDLWMGSSDSGYHKDFVTITGETHCSQNFKYLFAHITLHKKWSFPLRISTVNVSKFAETADLVTFTKEILNVKLRFLCSITFAATFEFIFFMDYLWLLI